MDFCRKKQVLRIQLTKFRNFGRFFYEIRLTKFEGKKIRYNKIFSPDGTNINFMKLLNEHHIKVWTYEKGIEDMVMSCGSGSVAAAYYAFEQNKIKSPVQISVPGGELKLTFNDNWSDVWLSGPAHLESEEDVEL